MKSKLIYPLVLVAGFGVACGGRSNASNAAAQQQYETVQEGSAAGVTSTIQGPGETLPPITGTNADTTNAFALNPGTMAPATAPAYPTASMPPPMMSSAPPPAYSIPAPVSRPVVSVPQQAAPAPAPTQTAEPQPAEAAGPATETDTAETAEPEEPKKEEPAAPPADDTSGTQAEEPPPPPPSA